MRNIKLTLCYDGAAFHGYQQQANAVTVESALKAALHRLLGEEVKPVSCSRTDSGVHARMFVCNFKTETDRENEKLLRGLNALLPSSVAVTKCEDVPLDFHARYDCRGKEYRYLIWNAPVRDPFSVGRAVHVPYALDSERMNKAAQLFCGTHDFSAYCASGSEVKSKVRTVYRCRVEREGDLVVFSVCGNGFLYNMVRIMAGTLLSLSAGGCSEDDILRSLQSGDRDDAGPTAKAEGLYLNKVFYEEDDFDGEEPEKA